MSAWPNFEEYSAALGKIFAATAADETSKAIEQFAAELKEAACLQELKRRKKISSLCKRYRYCIAPSIWAAEGLSDWAEPVCAKDLDAIAWWWWYAANQYELKSMVLEAEALVDSMGISA